MSIRAILLSLAALAAATPASSCVTAGTTVAIMPVRWAERTPSAEQYRNVYPLRAIERELEGIVVLSCVVQPDRTFDTCRVVRETPPGWGFGEAALVLSRAFIVQPENVDPRVRVGARFEFAVEFRLQ